MNIPRIYLVASLLAPCLGAQSLVRVHGVAYDSLHAVALADAYVTLSGSGRTRSASSDDRGRFEIDSVAPGTYTLSMQHSAIDSIGFSGFSTRVVVTDGQAELHVNVPSFESLWQTACGAGRPPVDSGIVFGVIRDAAKQQPVPNARIELTWVDMTVNGRKEFSQKLFRASAQADSKGSYGICGAPITVGLSIRAMADSMSSGMIDLPPRDARVQRRDLVIAQDDPRGRGIVTGMLTDAMGRPFRDGRVAIDSLAEVRSGDDGKFTVRNVPAGTRQVEFLSLGMRPVVMTIDVTANETTTISAMLSKVTQLDTLKVVGATPLKLDFVRSLDERKRHGLGKIKDSTQIHEGTVQAVLRSFPSVEIKNLSKSALTEYVILLPAPPRQCQATVWVDRRRINATDVPMILGTLRPEDLAVVEVYPHKESVPLEFQSERSSCGAVAIWTKQGVQ